MIEQTIVENQLFEAPIKQLTHIGRLLIDYLGQCIEQTRRKALSVVLTTILTSTLVLGACTPPVDSEPYALTREAQLAPYITANHYYLQSKEAKKNLEYILQNFPEIAGSSFIAQFYTITEDGAEHLLQECSGGAFSYGGDGEVKKEYVITAHHCVGMVPISRIHLSQPFGSPPNQYDVTVTNWWNAPFSEIHLFEVENNTGKTFPTIEISAEPPKEPYEVISLSFPSDNPTAIVDAQVFTYQPHRRFRLIQTSIAAPGSSGGLVFTLHEGKPQLVGIITNAIEPESPFFPAILMEPVHLRKVPVEANRNR